jgi:ligand-binding sensor domain-containing protein
MLACLASLLIGIFGADSATTHPTAPGQPLRHSIRELDHAVWTIREGAPPGIAALAQSADGVLWVGAQAGLYRFDGVRFEAFELPSSQSLPSLSINVLLALPDSSLWIGYTLGGASALTHGRVVTYGERDGLPPGTITAMVRDSAGDIWAATTTGLARLQGGRWHRMGRESGYPSGMTADLLIDRRGTLWASTQAGVFILPRGAGQFVWRAPSLDPNGAGAGVPREAPDGSVWGASLTLGLTRLSDSAGRATPPRPAVAGLREAWGLFMDSRASAWVFTATVMIRVPLETTELADAGSGSLPRLLPAEPVPLASDPRTVLEDREGNVWVGTSDGVERFRETKLTPLVLPEHLVAPSIAPADGGSVWLGSFSHPLLALGSRAGAPAGVPPKISCVYRDLAGGVWAGGWTGLWHTPPGASAGNARFTRVALPEQPGTGDLQAIAQTLGGDLWVSIRGGRMKGVFRRRGSEWALAPLPPDYANLIALTVVADSTGRVWLGYQGNRLVLATGDSMRVYSDGDGLRVGSVTAILVRGARAWIGGETGLMLFDDGRFRALRATQSLRGISGII